MRAHRSGRTCAPRSSGERRRRPLLRPTAARSARNVEETGCEETAAMATETNTPAPQGDLSTFEKSTFEHGGRARDVYRKGSGPAVIVITEMPGISPMVLGFADRVVALGCSATLPDLFGEAGRDPTAAGKLSSGMRAAGTMLGACISREF